MDATKKYLVKNRSASMIVYSIPEMNIRREFAPGETKSIQFEELEKLTFQSGGRQLMEGFLQIIEDEATQELGIQREPEYNMSEKDIMDLILTGSQDAFLDCLDFAPTGVIDLIKQLSITLPMNDLQKRRALKDKTGFDVTTALANLEKEREDDTAPTTTETKARRVQPVEKTEARRTTSKYKVTTPTTVTEE